jgi:hypothetical protein
MKQIIFNEYPSTLRGDILAFSPTALSMFEEMKNELRKRDTIELYIGRISDTGIFISPGPTNFFNVTMPESNQLKVHYLSDIEDAGKQKMKAEKIIRLDNPLGEFPILSGYEEYPKFFVVGEELQHYKVFIEEARESLRCEIGNLIQLCYKNDITEKYPMGTFSAIEGRLKEVNKGNILMEDNREFLIIDNKVVKDDQCSKRMKNHRFVSENGFLISAGNAMFSAEPHYDDGYIPGENKSPWNFIPHTKKVAV